MRVIHNLIARNRAGEAVGLPCFCTANEHVLRAILAFAAKSGLPTVIEATCNQVNQDGGYAGMTPETFRSWLGKMAQEAGALEAISDCTRDSPGPRASLFLLSQ